MLQLLAWYYGPYYLWGANISGYRYTALILGFVLNYAAYFTRRADLLSKKRLIRSLILMAHPGWFRDYLRYGVGIRSLLRDLIAKPEKAGGK